VTSFKHDAPLLVLLLFLFLASTNLAGQRGGSQVQMGNHSIEIHLMNQKGNALNVSARVEVLTEAGMRMAEAYSNREEGVADFDGFNDGYFQLRVTGPEVETVTQSFQIPATEATHREYVRVELKNVNRPGESASPGTDPTVSAQDLSVPSRARDEFNRGMEAHAKGDEREAQEALQRAVDLYPKYISAHNNLGVLYLKLGLKDKAFIEFSKAVEFDPKFVPGYVNLAKVAISNGNYSEAEPKLKRALEVDPSAVNAMVLLCSTEFARQEYPDALLLIRHVQQLTQDRQYADLHLLAADILVSQKKNREAVAEYDSFVKESPDDQRVPKVKDLITRLSAK